MDILKAANEWAKAEIFSSTFFIIAGVLFVAAGIGFWQFGKTDLAKAYIFPTLIAGAFLLVVGLGLFFTNKSRSTSFADTYNKDASAFVESELVRAEKTLKEYKNIAFRIFPLMVVLAALLLVFIDKPIWRAIAITTIAMLVIIMLVDSNAYARMEAYQKQLVEAQSDV